ncbi:MAG: hypothetical protein ACLU7D_04725 [Collinsella sp.]
MALARGLRAVPARLSAPPRPRTPQVPHRATRPSSRRFQTIDVEEPSVEDTVKILTALKPRYEEHHHVRYTQGAIEAAANLSNRYIQDRFLPDKAIDLIDEAGARARISGRGIALPEPVRSRSYIASRSSKAAAQEDPPSERRHEQSR